MIQRQNLRRKCITPSIFLTQGVQTVRKHWQAMPQIFATASIT